jgi:alpha-L-rhamnosidase
MVTPAMSYFLHKGLCNYGYVDESFELFQNRFDNMLQPQYNGTLWEEWWLDGTGRTGNFQGGRTRSDAQTESAFAPALFAEYIAGIIPVKPGMKEVVIQRTGFSVMDLDCIVPTPKGKLKVRWEVGSDAGKLILEVPSGILVTLDVASLHGSDKGEVKVNGKKLNLRRDENTRFCLKDGSFTIEF